MNVPMLMRSSTTLSRKMEHFAIVENFLKKLDRENMALKLPKIVFANIECE